MKGENLVLKQLKDRLLKIHPMETPEALLGFFLKAELKKLVFILASIMLLLILPTAFHKEENILQEGNQINRPGFNGSQQKVDLRAIIGAGESTEIITVPIDPEKYTRQEFEAAVKEALPALEREILGENLSSDRITDSLNLPESLPDSPIEISWESDREEVINREGAVTADIADKEGSLVTITAIFRYGEYKINHSFSLLVKPPLLSERQRIYKALVTAVNESVLASEYSDRIQLPGWVEGRTVVYEEEKRKSSVSFFVYIAFGILLWLVLLKEGLERKEKERERQLLVGYPELISQLTLLLSAGMTVGGAWKRLLGQYEENMGKVNGKRAYLQEEMMLTWREMQNGISERDAIERFGSRIQLAPYLKLASLLSQNIRKGSRELISLLRLEGKMAYDERKETAKQMGEEAGTKLLFPMLIMLGIVLVILLVPAFLSF